MLLADVEPERVLKFLADVDYDPSIHDFTEASALLSLARQDPRKAEAFLKAADWRGERKQKAELAVFSGWVKVDFKQALRYLEESGLSSGMDFSLVAAAGQDREARNEMRKAIAEMDDSSKKRGLTSALLAAEYSAEGFESVSRSLSEMNFATPKDRDDAISKTAFMALLSQPREAVEWVQKEVSPERRGKYVSGVVAMWAYQDFQAAGEWLKGQEPSSDTDHMISTYASTVIQIDPKASMVWADEIQDEKRKERTRKSSLREWHKADPAAARDWVVEQGWEVEEWLPNSE